MDLALAAIDLEDTGLIRWAARVAATANERLAILVVLEDRSSSIKRVRGAADDDLLDAVTEVVEGLDNRDVIVYACRGPKADRAILAGMTHAGVHRLVFRANPAGDEGKRAALVRKLMGSLPHHLMLRDVPRADTYPRIVIPQLRGGGEHALQSITSRILSDDTELLAVPDPSALARSRRVFERVRSKCSPGLRARMTLDAETNATIEDALATVLNPEDLLVIDLEHPKQLSTAHAMVKKLFEIIPEHEHPSVAMTRNADAAGDSYIERQFQRIRAHLPILPREDRKKLSETLEPGGRLSTDFAAMLALSAAIASFGLIQGSAAVVVGAMLVAPLMTPLVAAGMALVQGNAMVFRQALIAMGGGILGGLAVALAVGFISPWDDLSAEVIARTAPNLFDLAIAGLSGFAGAYALARPGLAGTLAGVSIAVALVPPLGAVGIATAKGEFALAFGASMLFATNLVAIILGAASAFRFFGLHIASADDAPPVWVRAATVLLAAAGLAISVPLISNQLSQARDGVNRPLFLPLPRDLRDDITARVALEPGVELLHLSRPGIEAADAFKVILIAQDAVPRTLIEDLATLVTDHYGDQTRVQVVPVVAAGVSAN
ncbi:MAG: DUF389 domain-containing protein [Planctomycetota bacterium]